MEIFKIQQKTIIEALK